MLTASILSLVTIVLCCYFLQSPPLILSKNSPISLRREDLLGSFRSDHLRYQIRSHSQHQSWSLNDWEASRYAWLRDPEGLHSAISVALKVYLGHRVWSHVWSRALAQPDIPDLRNFRKSILSGGVEVHVPDNGDVRYNTLHKTTAATTGYKFDSTYPLLLRNTRRMFASMSLQHDGESVKIRSGFRPFLSVKVGFDENTEQSGGVFVFGNNDQKVEQNNYANHDIVTQDINELDMEVSEGELSVQVEDSMTVSTDTDLSDADEDVEEIGISSLDKADNLVQLLCQLSPIDSIETLESASAILDTVLDSISLDKEDLQRVIGRVLVMLGWIKSEPGVHEETELSVDDRASFLLILSELVTKSCFPISGVEIILAFLNKTRNVDRKSQI